MCPSCAVALLQRVDPAKADANRQGLIFKMLDAGSESGGANGVLQALLQDQHGIAVAEEPVTLPDGLAVGRKHGLPSGKGADQQQQA